MPNNKNSFLLEEELQEFIALYGCDRTALLPILRAVQKRYRHIPKQAMIDIAQALQIPPTKVEGVVTFYPFLSTKQEGFLTIYLCSGLTCKMAGIDAIARVLEKEFGIKVGETTEDRRYTLKWMSCLGFCDHAPAILVNDTPIFDISPKNVVQKIKKYEKLLREKRRKISPIPLIPVMHKNRFQFDKIEVNKGLGNILDKDSETIIKILMDAKLRETSGYGFPVYLKIKLAFQEKAETKYVICNAAENEPGAFKDREILTNYADFVFAGMTIVAKTIGAKEGILYLRPEYEYLLPHLNLVLTKRRKDGFNFDIKLFVSAGSYISGEETGLIEALEGKRSCPRNQPPYPTQRGYLKKPTYINNVETFAWIACILAEGAEWFVKVGTDESAGYRLFSISGDCTKSGVYEFKMGTSIPNMLKTIGGEGAISIQSGGATGECFSKLQLKRKLTHKEMPLGGSIIIFGNKRSALEVAENLLTFFANESCGQCPVCRIGTTVLRDKIRAMRARENVDIYDHLIPLCIALKQASKCQLGRESINIVMTIIQIIQIHAIASQSIRT